MVREQFPPKRMLFQAMTSKGTIVAFNDDTDEAIIKYNDKTFFAVPSEFITTSNRYLEKSSSRNQRPQEPIDDVSNVWSEGLVYKNLFLLLLLLKTMTRSC